jgi:NTE family protein
MELKLDISKTYAIALEGGGAKGAYEIGVWKALEEEGIRFNAVSGTSVGALNGAFFAMRNLARAESVWDDIRFSRVMNVNDDEMRALFKAELRKGSLRTYARRAL